MSSAEDLQSVAYIFVSLFYFFYHLGYIDAIVVTEETVRGIDFMWLDCVFLMNVPRSYTEYLHICGRVGRMGKQGKAIILLDSERELIRLQSIYSNLKISGEELK